MQTQRGKHSCRFCDKCFDRPCKLTRHEESHKVKPFICRFCGKAFRDSHMANVHVLAFHKPELKSNQKQQYFQMIDDYDGKHSRKTGRHDEVKHRHRSTLAGGIDAAACRNYLCDCGLGFKRKRRIRQHQMYCQIHTNRVKARESEKNESQRENRLKKSKSNTSHEFRCDRCLSTFRSMEYLQEHKRHAHKRKKAQPSRAHLKRNQNSGRKVVNKATVSTHSSSSTMVTRSAVKLALKKKRRGNMACSICGKFLAKRSFSFHRKLHNLAILNAKYKNELMSTMQVLYLCRYETCNQAFLTTDKLSCHEVVHLRSKPFMCNLCDKLFRTESHHKKHVSTCMRQLTGIACRYCGKYFGRNVDLIRHEDIHVQMKGAPYFCGHCSKDFPTRPELNRHHFIVHQSLKPQSKAVFYQCMFCSMQMPSKSKLLDHAQTDHWSEIASTTLMDGLSGKLTDGEKQWECNQCSKTFGRKIFLTEHEKTHSARAPFKCNRCERTFMLRMALKRHSVYCPSAVATSTSILEEATETVEATEEHDEDIISISSSSQSPSPPASPEMQSVQIQRLKPVPVRRPGSTEIQHQFTVPPYGDCAVTASSATSFTTQPRDQIYLIQYSSEHMTHGPLTISLPDINTSRSAIRILPPECVSLSVPIPVKLERVF